MLELGEDECGADDLGDVPGAGGGVLEGGPALGEQGEAVFSLEAEAAQQGVPGTGVELLVSAGVLHGDVDADPGALVAAVGQGLAIPSAAAGQRAGQGVLPGGGDVVDVTGPSASATRVGLPGCGGC